MKSIYAKLCLVLLSASLVCALILATALASVPSNDNSSNNVTEASAETTSEATPTEPGSTSAIPTADDGTSLTNDGPYSITLETSAQVMKRRLLKSSNSGSSVTLNAGNYEKWIDRINVDDAAKKFYAMLEEATDNDGINDYLIDDKYFNGTAVNEEGYSGQIAAGNYYVFNKTGADGTEKPTYMVIYGGIPYTSEADLETKKNQAHDTMAAVYAAFDRDHPEVFWLGGKFSYGFIKTSYEGADSGTMYPYFVLKSSDGNARATDYDSKETIKTTIAQNSGNVNKIMSTSEVSNASTNYDKVVAFNDWLTKNNAYNSSVAGKVLNFTSANYPDGWECTSALAGRTGETGPVCEGYARAFKVLCDNVNIPCVLVDGQAKNSTDSTGEAHMWNYVQVGSKWYGVDVTWNDPYIAENANAATSGSEGETWLLVGSETEIKSMPFLTSHPVTNCLYDNGVEFTNGPVLNTTSYAEDVKNAETVDLGSCVVDPASPLSATYGDLLADISLNGLSMKTSDGTEVAGTFAWKNSKLQIKTCEDISYTAVFTVDGDETNTKEVDIQLSVSQKTLTVNAGAINDKTYDGNATATFSIYPTINDSDVITGDNVSLTYSATFDNADVGDNKTVTIDYGLEGTDAGNYTLSTIRTTVQASITQYENPDEGSGGETGGDDNPDEGTTGTITFQNDTINIQAVENCPISGCGETHWVCDNASADRSIQCSEIKVPYTIEGMDVAPSEYTLEFSGNDGVAMCSSRRSVDADSESTTNFVAIIPLGVHPFDLKVTAKDTNGSVIATGTLQVNMSTATPNVTEYNYGGKIPTGLSGNVAMALSDGSESSAFITYNLAAKAIMLSHNYSDFVTSVTSSNEAALSITWKRGFFLYWDSLDAGDTTVTIEDILGGTHSFDMHVLSNDEIASMYSFKDNSQRTLNVGDTIDLSKFAINCAEQSTSYLESGLSVRPFVYDGSNVFYIENNLQDGNVIETYHGSMLTEEGWTDEFVPDTGTLQPTDNEGVYTIAKAGTAKIGLYYESLYKKVAWRNVLCDTITIKGVAASSGTDPVTPVTPTTPSTPTTPTANPAKSVTLSTSSKQATVGDAAFKLTATVSPSDADGSISWKSSNTKVATVSSDGTVEVVSAGQTTITASIGNVSATCTVTVSAKNVSSTADGSSYSADVEATDIESAKKLEIIVTGKGDVRLVVQIPEKITDAVWSVISKFVASGITVAEAIDVFLQGSQGEITIGANDGVSMTVRLKMTDAIRELDPDTLKVVYISDDGTTEDKQTWVEGDEVCFTTEHFSKYIVTGKKRQQQPQNGSDNGGTDGANDIDNPGDPAEPTEPTDANGLIQTPTPNYTRVSSGLSVTGDPTVDTLLAVGSVALLSVVIALIAVRKSRKRKMQ